MKTGFLYALLVMAGTFIIGIPLSFLIQYLFPPLRNLDSYKVGELIGRVAWFLAFVAFVVGWIRQANRKAVAPRAPAAAPAPENLQPIDYSKLSQIYDDDRKA